MSKKVVFKPYNQDKPLLFPPRISDFIPENHPVRVVNELIEKIDITPILKTYKGGGASSYHPKMMLKIIIYAYLNNIYSSREIERQVKENIMFMWLAAYNTPDHNTINSFRSKKLKGTLKTIFKEIVLFLNEQGVLDIECVYVDGTKIEANANKYSFVWKKNVQRNKRRIQERLEELWDYAESVSKEGMKRAKPVDFSKLTSEDVEEAINTINRALKGKPIDSKKKIS